MAERPMKKNERKKHHYFSRKKTSHGVGFADFTIDNTRSSVIFSITLLISLSQLFCGIVIPLSHSFVTTSQRGTGVSYYLEIFLVSQYFVAILGIFYLLGYVYIHERSQKSDVPKTQMAEFGDKKVDDDSENQEELVDTENTKVKFNLSQPLMYEEDNIPPRLSEMNDNGQISVNSTHSILLKSFSSMSDTSSITSQSLENNAFIQDNEGINLYLRLGAVAFGFGVMVHDGFKIADQLRLQSTDCHNELWTPKHALHLAYIFCQTFFIFKYHKIIFSKQKSFLRFILCQLAVINICQWFKAVVFEINAELTDHGAIIVYPQGDTHSNKTQENLTCIGQMSQSVSPYLFPCAIEYGLISAAIFYKILQKVGQQYQEKLILRYPNYDKHKYSGCHRSHRGLFIGLLFFMATLVGLAMFLTFKKKPSTKYLAVMVYQISEIILLVSSVIALTCASIKMRVLKFRQLREEEALDDNLVLIGLAGVFAYNLFLLISTIYSTINVQKCNSTLILFICKSLTEIVQSLLQVLFILEGSRKCAGSDRHISEKPGRSYLTFLIICNLALWIVSIFEAKRAEEHLLFTNYYEKTPWSIIIHTLLPLIIFFRFHSTICLSDIWTNSYKMKISKKKMFIRQDV